MNPVETILVYAVIPLAIYGLAGALTLRRKSGEAPRHRSGQAWGYPAMWFSAHPDGVGDGHRHAGAEDVGTAVPAEGASTAAGGARGNW